MRPSTRFLVDSKQQWPRLFFVGICVILATLFEVAAPLYLGQIVDAIVFGLTHDESIAGIMNRLMMVIVYLFGLYLGHALFTYLTEYIMASASQASVLALRKRLSEKIHHLPLFELQDKRRGDLLSRMTADLDAVSENLQECVPDFLSALTGIVGAVAMMLYLSPLLGITIVFIIVAGFTALVIVSKKANTVYRHNQEALGAFHTGVDEIVSGKTVISAFGLEETMTEHIKGLNHRLLKTMRNATFIGQMIYPLVNMLNQFGYILVALLGGYLVIIGGITIGNMQSFFLYVSQVSDPISRISYIVTRMQETFSALGRCYEILDIPDEINHGTQLLSEHAKGQVEFQDVYFRYTPDKPLMEGISFTIPSGSMAAIVGPTGAGKTTIVNLLMRFFEIQGGSIRIDGTDIRDLTRENLHHHVSMVLQDSWIFTGSIADNIGYGKPDASREDIVKVAKLARADYFIRTLPKGYDTILTNGGEDLSVGQRQLLTIARAFLANPDILILDEATANVDTRTEVEVQKAMSSLLKGRTSIVIAHRLSTIASADLLLVVKDGTIIEQGSHDELLQEGGYYQELYDNYTKGIQI